ncbi:unnamed protein product [Rotaria socialis]|uniref:Uncharacterized protein n=1 Tax=Rotaria socialis TaxID=392032 RepID=A0A817TIH5_9BILA|nr:unnamed protein product [Rotaria socialis]
MFTSFTDRHCADIVAGCGCGCGWVWLQIILHKHTSTYSTNHTHTPRPQDSIVLIEALDLVCVADRVNGRIVYSDDEINDDDGDDETNENNQSQVKAIIDHPLMRTVYAIHYDPIIYRLYAVSGRLGQSHAMGFTFSVHPESFGQSITTWEPNDKFGDPHDLALSVNGRSLYVGEIRPNRIDSFNVLN